MHASYSDIRSKIAEQPRWWDENAVPRYCTFHPSQCANIYAEEAALVGITCQECGTRFKVAFTRGRMERVLQPELKLLADSIRDRALHYGDPPSTGCCPAGPTMNSEPRRVLEYWHREDFEWVREPALEIDVEPDWVSAE